LLLAIIACASPFPASIDAVTSQATQTSPTNTSPLTTSPDDRKQAMRAGFEHDLDEFEQGLHYSLNLHLELGPVRLRGHQRTHYVNTTGVTLKDIVFRLVANGLYSKILETVTNVTAGGTPADTALSVNNSVLTVTLPQPLAADANIDIEMDTVLDLPPNEEISYGRLADNGDIILLSSFFPMVSVYEKGAWWTDPTVEQGDPAYSESALFDVSLTAPSSLKLAASGITIAANPGDSGTTDYQLISGPIRDFTLTLSPNFELQTQTQDGVTVNIWSSPGDSRSDDLAMQKTLKSLEIFDKMFGKYPFSEFDVVESPMTALGIEYPGLVYIAKSAWSYQDSNLFEFVLSHEIGHQWWYSLVGNDQINEPWVDEALADYSVIVYFREQYGVDAGNRVRDYYQRDVNNYVSEHGTRMPTGLPVKAYDEDQYGTFVYSAGALYYSRLEDDYHTDRVTQMLQAYFTRHRYGLAHSADLRSITVEFFGDKAGAFFDDWVKGK